MLSSQDPANPTYPPSPASVYRTQSSTAHRTLRTYRQSHQYEPFNTHNPSKTKDLPEVLRAIPQTLTHKISHERIHLVNSRDAPRFRIRTHDIVPATIITPRARPANFANYVPLLGPLRQHDIVRVPKCPRPARCLRDGHAAEKGMDVAHDDIDSLREGGGPVGAEIRRGDGEIEFLVS